MIAKIKAAGAYEVIQHGAALAEADVYMREELMPQVHLTSIHTPYICTVRWYHANNNGIQAGPAAIYAPPFDHPDIWCGNATVMHEIASQMPSGQADVVICSVGGGGLLNGVAQALDDLSLTSSTTVVGVETQGAESLQAAVRAGQLVTLPHITSQATSLGCARVTQQTLRYAQRANVRSVVLPDSEAAMGCWRLADDERIMVELACGVNVALCYGGRLERALGRKVRPDEKVVIVLCGGSNVTVDMLAEWRSEYAYLDVEAEAEKEKEIRDEEVERRVAAKVPKPARRPQWEESAFLEAKL